MATERSRPLEGRSAVVTGVGSGLGQAIAREFAAEGALVLGCDVDDAAGAATMSGIGEYLHADVSREAEVEALVARAVERHGRLHVMVNNAAVQIEQELAETTEEQLDRILAVNLKGVFFGCQAAVRAMIPRGTGSIVNVSSAAIDFPAPGNSAYAMSKAAVAMLTMTLAVEAGPHGIRVNAIAPGVTLTNFTTRHMVKPDGTLDRSLMDERVEQLRAMSPLGLVGEPDDQAHLVLYLASDASKYATGAIFRANGGVGIAW